MDLDRNNSLKIRFGLSTLFALLPGMYYIGNLIRMLGMSMALYRIGGFVAGVIGILTLLFSNKNKYPTVYLFLAVYLFSLLIGWLVVGNIGFSSILSSLLLVGVSILMIQYPWGYRYGAFIFYLSASLMLFRIAGSPTRRVLTSSANYISIVMLLAVFFYYIPLERGKRKLRLISLLPSVISFLISVWAGGRGGILCTIFLMVTICTLYVVSLSQKKPVRIASIFIVVLLIGIILWMKNYNLVNAFMSLGKWKLRGTDNTARLIIWKSYIDKVKESVIYFLFGAPLDSIWLVKHYEGNLHNSFLQLHAYNGMFGFLVIIVMIWRAARYYFYNKKNITLILMIVIIIRGMTDKFIFGQYGMPVLLYFILVPCFENQQVSNEENSILGKVV